MLGELVEAHEARSHGYDADLVGAGSADVVGVIADQRYLAALADPLLAPRLPNGEPHQSGAVLGVFGKGAEAEVGLKPGVLHLHPGDAAQIAGDESDRRAPPVEPSKQLTYAGTDLLPQVGARLGIQNRG